MIHIFLILIINIQSQTNIPQTCNITYNDPNDPKFNNKCDQQTFTCNFNQSLSNLVINKSVILKEQDFVFCIVLDEYTINFGPNVTDDFQNSIYVQANKIIFLQNYVLTNDFSMVYKANTSINSTNSVYLSGGLLWMQTTNLNIFNSTFQNNSYLQSQCSCYDQNSGNCDVNNWSFSIPILYQRVNSTYQQFNISILNTVLNYSNLLQYNSIIFNIQNSTNITSSNIVSSIIGIFSTNISISASLISTTGNGFPSASGYGCGYFDQILNQLLGCTGSGGSYGGFGGNSSPDNCNLMISRSPYFSKLLYPILPGSGGGFFVPNIKQASSGGGIINIQGLLLEIWNSNIQSNGKQGIQGGGGGSGGSLALDYKKLEGNSFITVNGGGGKSSGGGGRIWLWNHDWMFQQYNRFLSSFTITANSGTLGCQTQLSCGQKGSIITSPCQPGFQLNLKNYICQQCYTGYYQSQFGYSQCQQCLNKPQNSVFIQTNQTKLFKQACKFQCMPGYIQSGDICQTKFTSMINQIGGINMLISVGIVIAVIIGYLIVVLFQKLTEKDIFIKKKQKDSLQRRMNFKVQDIPFHQKRIYFQGQNSPKRPWLISQQAKQQYRKYQIGSLSKLDPILNKMMKQINEISRYSKTKIVTLYILKLLYYPMSKYLQSIFKEKISDKIQKLINQANKVFLFYQNQNFQIVPQVQKLGIKYHVQPFYSVGCIQIFNYSKSALDFYIQNYFPIYFRLQKMPLGGYSIDLNDPLMKAFISQIDQKSQNKMYERFLVELDQLMRNTQQLVPILNHLYIMAEYNPSIHVYLFQTPDSVIGIQKQYSIRKQFPLFLVFSSQNINTHHFIHNYPLSVIYHDKVDYFKHQYHFRQQVTQQDKKSIFWEISNNFNQKILSWVLGILMIFLLLQFVVEFFILIFVAVEPSQNSFTYGIIIYILVEPLNQFFMIILSFKLILSKNCCILANCIYFTLSNIVKLLILFIIGLVKIALANTNNSQDSNSSSDTLQYILFYLWIVSLVCTIVALFLQLLLHPHYSKHYAVQSTNHHSKSQILMNTSMELNSPMLRQIKEYK